MPSTRSTSCIKGARGARNEKAEKTIGDFGEEIYYTDVCFSTNPEDFLTPLTIS